VSYEFSLTISPLRRGVNRGNSSGAAAKAKTGTAQKACSHAGFLAGNMPENMPGTLVQTRSPKKEYQIRSLTSA
jgi:hypothetical protein